MNKEKGTEGIRGREEEESIYWWPSWLRRASGAMDPARRPPESPPTKQIWRGGDALFRVRVFGEGRRDRESEPVTVRRACDARLLYAASVSVPHASCWAGPCEWRLATVGWPGLHGPCRAAHRVRAVVVPTVDRAGPCHPPCHG